jgi:peptidoglycan/LPS O-acetylase OafA/YrhL
MTQTTPQRSQSDRANPSRSPSYRHEIDGLRALAVIAVVINHLNKSILPGGYLGVDIFFVISGYVITSSLFHRPIGSLRELLLVFYARRVKRLLPALITCIGLTALIGFLFIPPSSLEFTPSYETGVAALFGLSNIYLMQISSAYFAPSTQLNLFTQTWSLGVEEQFYLVFPLLLWGSGFTQRRPHHRRHLFWILATLTTLSLATFGWLHYNQQLSAYFLMTARFWEIAAGCLTFLVMQGHSKAGKWLKSNHTGVIMVGLVGMLLLPESQQAIGTLAIVLLTTLLLCSLNQSSPLYPVLTSKPVQLIGLTSYSIYLWHWSVLAISRWTIGIYWWTVPFQVLAIGVLAGLSYRLIEQPLRHQVGFKSPLKTIAIGLVSITLAATSLHKLGTDGRGKLYQGNNVNPNGTWWVNKAGQFIEKCHLKDGYSEGFWQDCVPASLPGKPRVYLFGDSHARNYLKGIEAAFPGVPVHYATMGWGCTYMPKQFILPEVDRQYRCTDYVNAVDAFVAHQLNRGDVVIIGQDKGHQKRAEHGEMIIRLARQVVQKGGKFVLLADTPGLEVDLMTCLQQPWRRSQPASCDKTLDQVKTEQQQLDAIGRSLEMTVPGTKYLDVRDGLCLDNLCSAYRHEMILYHDTTHLTDEASAALGPRIRQELGSITKMKN